MQEQQAELEARLQHKQLEVMKAAEQFRPVMANLEKVWLSQMTFGLAG